MLWLNKGMEIKIANKKVKRLFLKVIYTVKTTANGRSQKPRNNTDFEEEPNLLTTAIAAKTQRKQLLYLFHFSQEPQ